MMAMSRARSGSSVSKMPPACGYTFDGRSCRKRGAHRCEKRADHAQAFIEEICVHTKGRYSRAAFVLTNWQRDEIVRPLFGETVWSTEQDGYVRRYRVAWIEI